MPSSEHKYPVSAPTTLPLVTPDEREEIASILNQLSAGLVEIGPSLSDTGKNLKKKVTDLSKRSPRDLVWEDIHYFVDTWQNIETKDRSRLPDNDGKISRLSELEDLLKARHRYGYPDVRLDIGDPHRDPSVKLTWCWKRSRDAVPSNFENYFEEIDTILSMSVIEPPNKCRTRTEDATKRHLGVANPSPEMMWRYLRDVKGNMDDLSQGGCESLLRLQGTKLFKRMEKRLSNVYEGLASSIQAELSLRVPHVSGFDAYTDSCGVFDPDTGVPRLSNSEAMQVADSLNRLLMPSIKSLLPEDQSEEYAQKLQGKGGQGAYSLVEKFEEWIKAAQENGAIFNIINHHDWRGSAAEEEDFLVVANLATELADVRSHTNRQSDRAFQRLVKLRRSGKLGEVVPASELAQALDEAPNKIRQGSGSIHKISSARKPMSLNVEIFRDSNAASGDSDGMSEIPGSFSRLTFRSDASRDEALTTA
jgi:hypothetical protein